MCEDATLVAPGRPPLMIEVFDLVRRIESRMPDLRAFGFGISNCSGSGFGSGGAMISGMACCECARKESEVSHM